MAIKNVSISNVVAVQNACYVMGVEEVWCQIKFTDCVNFCEYIADPNSGEALSRELYTRLQDGDYGELNHGTGDHYTLQPKTQTELEAAVKATRTQRLLESDWTWSTYRQALRDVPAQTRFPWDPDWPTSP